MVSEIQTELENNYKQMVKLMGEQKFTVADAENFLARYYNIVRKMEDLETSRDLWRTRLKAIDSCDKCEVCKEHSKGGKKNE